MKNREHKFILNGKIPEACSDIYRWAKWYENSDRHVADTEVEEMIRVSTVFLGIDHNWSLNGDPVLFETMCFALRDFGADDLPCNRYCTWDEALKGHHEIVQQCRLIIALAGANSKSQLKRIAAQSKQKEKK